MAAHTSTFTARDGGVLTSEADVITGELELRTEHSGSGELTVTVRYAGAEEWYRVRGTTVTVHDERDAAAVHEAITGVLSWIER